MTRHEFIASWQRAVPTYRITPSDMDVVSRAEGLGTLKGLPEKFCEKAADFLDRSNWGVTMRAAINNVNLILGLEKEKVNYPKLDNSWADEFLKEE